MTEKFLKEKIFLTKKIFNFKKCFDRGQEPIGPTPLDTPTLQSKSSTLDFSTASKEHEQIHFQQIPPNVEHMLIPKFKKKYYFVFILLSRLKFHS